MSCTTDDGMGGSTQCLAVMSAHCKILQQLLWPELMHSCLNEKHCPSPRLIHPWHCVVCSKKSHLVFRKLRGFGRFPSPRHVESCKLRARSYRRDTTSGPMAVWHLLLRQCPRAASRSRNCSEFIGLHRDVYGSCEPPGIPQNKLTLGLTPGPRPQLAHRIDGPKSSRKHGPWLPRRKTPRTHPISNADAPVIANPAYSE